MGFHGKFPIVPLFVFFRFLYGISLSIRYDFVGGSVSGIHALTVHVYILIHLGVTLSA